MKTMNFKLGIAAVVSSIAFSAAAAITVSEGHIDEALVLKAGTAAILFVGNIYAPPSTMPQLLGAKKDSELFAGTLGSVVVLDKSTANVKAAISAFANVDCGERDAARILWFSGQSVEAFDTQSNTHAYVYIDSSFTNPTLNERQIVPNGLSMNAVSFEWVLLELSASSCKYIVGFDVTPPRNPLTIPKNVAAIWADSLGGKVLDSSAGGLLTRSFIDIAGKANIIYLPVLAKQLSEKFVAISRAEKLDPSKPWVQGANDFNWVELPKKGSPLYLQKPVQIIPFNSATR